MIVAADKIMYERKVSRKRFALTHNVGVANRPPSDLSADFPNIYTTLPSSATI
ncbi:MAG: hypothetical protein IPP63_19585 [Chloracidobacterium sp.]|nr:hypothetical protein [Chloracidobacterium sp.]